MSEFNSCLRRGQVIFGDDFSSVNEVTRLFGAVKNPYKPCFDIPGREAEVVWMPSGEGSAGWHDSFVLGVTCDSRGWREILSIDEYNDDPATNTKHINDVTSRIETQLVFKREERHGTGWYKFYGAFEVDVEATCATLGTDHPRVIHRRISKSVECLKVEEICTSFTDVEFSALKGRMVRADFLDDMEVIESAVKKGDKPEKRFVEQIWPGTEFVVTGVSGGLTALYCSSSKIDGIFVIPRRDFELGYVEVLPNKEN